MEIYGIDVAPQVGGYVVPDGWPYGGILKPGDMPAGSGYPGCAFRIETGLPIIKTLAARHTAGVPPEI